MNGFYKTTISGIEQTLYESQDNYGFLTMLNLLFICLYVDKRYSIAHVCGYLRKYSDSEFSVSEDTYESLEMQTVEGGFFYEPQSERAFLCPFLSLISSPEFMVSLVSMHGLSVYSFDITNKISDKIKCICELSDSITRHIKLEDDQYVIENGNYICDETWIQRLLQLNCLIISIDHDGEGLIIYSLCPPDKTKIDQISTKLKGILSKQVNEVTRDDLSPLGAIESELWIEYLSHSS
jgi:hypothetical protein